MKKMSVHGYKTRIAVTVLDSLEVLRTVIVIAGATSACPSDYGRLARRPISRF
jgi:hypothetical protein